MVVGLTGGSGSGKSTVARTLAQHGGFVIDADEVYHRLLASNPALPAELASVFGSGVLAADGSLDRRRLGEIVFSDREKLLALNKITHKFITREIMNIIDTEEHCSAFVVIDAAILFESGMNAVCDVVVAVTAPEEIRAARIMERDGVTKEQALRRLRSQTPQQELASRADIVLDTSGGIVPLREDIRKLAAKFTEWEGGKRC